MNKKLFEDIGKRVKKGKELSLGIRRSIWLKNGCQYTDDFRNRIR